VPIIPVAVCQSCNFREDCPDIASYPPQWKVYKETEDSEEQRFCSEPCLISFLAKENPRSKMRLVSDRLGLTDLDIELLRCIALGMSNSEISAQVRLAESTVKNRLSRAYKSLGAEDRQQAMLEAQARGILNVSQLASEFHGKRRRVRLGKSA